MNRGFTLPGMGPNFGDCLNDFLWPHLVRWEGEEINFFGIGTLLCAHFEKLANPAQPTHVFGSGAGIGKPLSAGAVRNWHFHWVRGPRTATSLGLPTSRVISDPALLIGDFFERPSSSDSAVMILHHSTHRRLGDLWRIAASDAGFELVDPSSPVETVLSKLSGANLVVTEAMHGAIVADALGIPWVPVVAAEPLRYQFKWLDYAEAMEIRYDPYVLPAITTTERLGRWREATRPGPLSPQWVNWTPRGLDVMLSRVGLGISLRLNDLQHNGGQSRQPRQGRRFENAVTFLEGLKRVRAVSVNEEVLERRKSQLYEALYRSGFAALSV